MAKQFGRDPLYVGMTCVVRDEEAHNAHDVRDHQRCRVRATEVGDDGYIRVGVSFHGHSGDRDDAVDIDGYSSQVSHWCFPHQLRKV